MSFLVHPLPPIDVMVRKEYLYDLEKGHGEYTPGVWISVKSVQYKALYFETLLTEYGALYDKLPLSAFVWKTPHGNLPLDTLQLWDCFDYHLTVIEKPILARCEFFGKDKKMHGGEYMFTIDNAHPDFGTRVTQVQAGPAADHATHVAGIVGGSGGSSFGAGGTPFQWRGMAPAVEMFGYRYTPNPIAFYNSTSDIEQDINHSYRVNDIDLVQASMSSNIVLNSYPCAWMGDYGNSRRL